MTTSEIDSKRLYVAGLNEQITEDDLKEKFSKFGDVHSVDLKTKHDSHFAFVELSVSPKKLAKCLSVYNNACWKGCKMQVQLAKESFLSRLKKEQEAAKHTDIRNGDYQKNIESFGIAINSGNPKSLKKSHGFSSSEKFDSTSKRKRSSNVAESNHSSATENTTTFEIASLSDSVGAGVHSVNSGKKFTEFNEISYEKKSKCGMLVESEENSIKPNSNLLANGVFERSESLYPRSSKKEMSNQQRMKSLQGKVAEANAKQRLIKESLNLDSVDPVNKKIVFYNESDDELSTVSKQKKQRSSEQCDKSLIEKQKGKPQKNLFDSSDSDTDERDNEDMFRVRPQFEGEAGQKLIELQSHYGNDRRFQLDERFMEDEEGNKVEEDVNELGDMEAEKRLQLEVLQDLLGHKVIQSKTNHKEKEMIQDWRRIKRMRYDPAQDNAADLEVSQAPLACPAGESTTKKKKKKKNKDKEILEKSTDETKQKMPEVSKERFYEVSDTFRETFGKGKKTDNQQSFSILASLGISEPSTEVRIKEDLQQGSELSIIQPRRGLDVNPFKYDSSGSDDDDNYDNLKKDENALKPAEEEDTSVLTSHVSRPTFFFFGGDNRLKDGVEFFRRPADMDKLVKSWEEKRLNVMKIVKSLRKHALRKKFSAETRKPRGKWPTKNHSTQKWKKKK